MSRISGTTRPRHRLRPSPSERPGHLRLPAPGIFLLCTTGDGAVIEGRTYRATELEQRDGGVYAHGWSLLRFVQVHPDADERRMAQPLSRIA